MKGPLSSFLVAPSFANFLGCLMPESRLLQPMDWAIGALQTEFLAGSFLVTLSVAKGAHPGCFSFSMLDARLLLLIRSLEIVSTRNSACTAPSAQSSGCSSLDSDTRRPKKAGNFFQKEKQHSGPYMCKG